MKQGVYDFVSVLLLTIGFSLIEPQVTGSVVGVISQSSIGILLIFTSFIFFAFTREGKLERKVNRAEKLLEHRKIPTKYTKLTSLASKMGYTLKEGKKHTQVRLKTKEGYKFVTQIPRHREINRDTARGILEKLDEYFAYAS